MYEFYEIISFSIGTLLGLVNGVRHTFDKLHICGSLETHSDDDKYSSVKLSKTRSSEWFATNVKKRYSACRDRGKQ